MLYQGNQDLSRSGQRWPRREPGLRHAETVDTQPSWPWRSPKNDVILRCGMLDMQGIPPKGTQRPNASA